MEANPQKNEVRSEIENQNRSLEIDGDTIFFRLITQTIGQVVIFGGAYAIAFCSGGNVFGGLVWVVAQILTVFNLISIFMFALKGLDFSGKYPTRVSILSLIAILLQGPFWLVLLYSGFLLILCVGFEMSHR